MGGIIQSGRSYTSTALQALRQREKTNRYFTQAADKTKEELQQLLLETQLQNNYLFCSAAEKSRTLYEASRNQNSSWQTQWAGKGLDTSSATVQLLLDKNKLQAQQAQAKLAQQAQAQIRASERQSAQTAAALREEQAAQHRLANKKSTVWKLTKKLFSFFN